MSFGMREMGHCDYCSVYSELPGVVHISRCISTSRARCLSYGHTPPMLCFTLLAFSLPPSRQRSVLARLLPVFVFI
jgi:hypothetical protein